MKKIGIAMLAILMVSCNMSRRQNQEKMNKENKKIIEVIQGFSLAGDKNDAQILSTYLDDNYRIVMNRLFGSKSVTSMSKTDYLKKIDSKVFGGDTRKVSFSHIIINGTTAFAQVIFKGKKATFNSLMILVKNETGDWKLVSDVPVIN